LLRRNGLEYVAADEELPLYRGLRSALSNSDPGELARRCLFFPLSPRSYHVTACDLGHADNCEDARAHHRHTLRQSLNGLPDSIRGESPFGDILETSELMRTSDWGICLTLDRVAEWSGVSVVACLKPADQRSADRLDVFVAARRQLCEQLRAVCGIAPPESFVPHVTLGYFANATRIQGLREHMGEWQRLLDANPAQTTLCFDSVSLYGFTDMETFFRPETGGARRPG
jgi:hypothetical protein